MATGAGASTGAVVARGDVAAAVRLTDVPLRGADRATGAGAGSVVSTIGAGAGRGWIDIGPGRIGTVTSPPLAGPADWTAGAGVGAVVAAGAVTVGALTTGGGVTSGAAAGSAACANDGVADKARTAAIAVRPGRTGWVM